MKKLKIPSRSTEHIEQPHIPDPQRSPEERELTRALKMVVDAYTRLGFEDFYILGLVNLIINGHIEDSGEFTEEYKRYADTARRHRDDPDLPQIITSIG